MEKSQARIFVNYHTYNVAYDFVKYKYIELVIWA